MCGLGYDTFVNIINIINYVLAVITHYLKPIINSAFSHVIYVYNITNRLLVDFNRFAARYT